MHGVHFGDWVGQREDNGVFGHGRDVLAGEQVGCRDPDEDVGPDQDLFEGADEVGAVGVLGDPGTELVHVLLARVHGAITAAPDDLTGALSQEQSDDRVPGRANPGYNDAYVLDAFVDDSKRVGQRRKYHDGCAVLVVVKDRDVQEFAQPGLDLEATGGRDVLQVDAAIHGSHGPDDLYQGVGVLGVEADRPGVDTAELLEQGCLTLHHWQRGGRPDVAQTKHGRAVGDHGHGVAFDGQVSCILRVLGNGHAHARHPGGVGTG